MEKNLQALLSNKRLIRYFIMAVIVVAIELGVFQVIYLVSSNYILATILSFALSVILNWVFGRLLVFGVSKHHPLKEFTMVLIASLVGVGIQVVVVQISVSLLHLYPFMGKVLSIIFSFFWNYWFRAKIVYKALPDK